MVMHIHHLHALTLLTAILVGMTCGTFAYAWRQPWGDRRRILLVLKALSALTILACALSLMRV